MGRRQDSDALEELGDELGGPPVAPRFIWKRLVALFLIFMLVISDVFASGVLGLFPGAMEGRQPTLLGSVLQAASCVGLYAGAAWLVDKQFA